MSESDVASLYDLASLCPGTNGPAIYQARALYQLLFSTSHEFGNCGDQSGARFASRSNDEKMISATKEPWLVDVFPNPTQDRLFVKTNRAEEELFVRITDLSGRRVFYSGVCRANGLDAININVANGMYFVKLVGQADEIVVKKLVIQK